MDRVTDGQLSATNYQSLKLKTKLNNERLKESLEAVKRQSQEGRIDAKRQEDRARGQFANLSPRKNGRTERPPRLGGKKRDNIGSQESIDAQLSATSKHEANEKRSHMEFTTFSQINLDKLEGEHDTLRDLLLTTQKGGFHQHH